MLIAILFISTGLYYIKCDNSYYKNLTLMIILALTTYFSHGVLNNYLDTDKAAIPVWGLISIFITITTILNRNTKKTT